MKYRCPHCGEQGFTFVERIDFLPRWLPEYFQGARCSICRERSVYHSRFGGRIGHMVIQSAIILLVPILVILLVTLPTGRAKGYWVWIALLLAAVALYGFKLLFCYLDKPHYADRVGIPKLRVAVDAAARLWPRVRVGEIYVMKFPKQGLHQDSPHVIGLIEKAEKDGNKRTLTVRVIKEYLPKGLQTEEGVWLLTDGDFHVEGVVTQPHRRRMEEE